MELDNNEKMLIIQHREKELKSVIEENCRLHKQISRFREIIEGCLGISDLWRISKSSEINEKVIGEYQSLEKMYSVMVSEISKYEPMSESTARHIKNANI